jgi:hypothetical protein
LEGGTGEGGAISCEVICAATTQTMIFDNAAISFLESRSARIDREIHGFDVSIKDDDLG